MRDIHAIFIFCVLLAATHAESNRDVVRRELSESSIGFDDDQNFYLVYSRGWDKFFDALYILFNVSNIGSFMGGSQMTTAGSRVSTAILPVVVGSSMLLGLCMYIYRPEDRKVSPVASDSGRQDSSRLDGRSMTTAEAEAEARLAAKAATDYHVDMKVTFLDNQDATRRHDSMAALLVSPVVHLMNASYVYATVGLVVSLFVDYANKYRGVQTQKESYWLWMWLDASVLDKRDLRRLEWNPHFGMLLVVRIAQVMAAPMLWVYGAILFGFHLLVLGISYARGRRGQIEWFPSMHGPVTDTPRVLSNEVELDTDTEERRPLATPDRRV